MGPRVSSRAVIGRDDAREVVESLLELAAAGRARLALVAGEAGIGKTRLVGDLEVQAGERGFVVLHGESIEFGGDELPYAPVVAALRDLPADWAAEALDALPGEARDELGALLPRALVSSEAPARFSGRFGQGRLYELLLDLLRVTAGGSPHLWIVDPALFPDAGARRAILADVHHPWSGARERRFTGRLTRRRPERSLSLRVPLDGTVEVEATGSARLRPELTPAAGSTVLARGRRRLRYVDCGRRVLRLTIRARRGSGRFAITARRP